MAENNRNWRDDSQYDGNMNENRDRNQQGDYGSQDYGYYGQGQRRQGASWQNDQNTESYGSGHEYRHSDQRSNIGNMSRGNYGQSGSQRQSYQGHGEFSGNNPVSYGGRAGTRSWENDGNFDAQRRDRGMNRIEDQSYGNQNMGMSNVNDGIFSNYGDLDPNAGHRDNYRRENQSGSGVYDRRDSSYGNYGDSQGSSAHTHRTNYGGGIFGTPELYSPMRDTQSELYARMGGHTQGSMYGIQDMGYTQQQQQQQQGMHRGKGPKGYRRSDDRIREDVCDRLCDDPRLDASDMEITVKDCEVILTGTVDSREAKRRAEDLAESISGVSNVENRLKVRQESSMDDMMRNRMDGSRSSNENGRSSSMSSGTPSASSDGMGSDRKNKTS